jgi:hypothetical protein
MVAVARAVDPLKTQQSYAASRRLGAWLDAE